MRDLPVVALHFTDLFESCFTGIVKLKVSAPAYAIGKVLFLRPLTGWNLSFEDIKRSILATGACDTTKHPWSRKDRCFEHSEEEGEASVNPPYVHPIVVPMCLLLYHDEPMTRQTYDKGTFILQPASSVVVSLFTLKAE